MKAVVCALNKEKALVGAFSGHCVTSRRFVDCSVFRWFLASEEEEEEETSRVELTPSEPRGEVSCDWSTHGHVAR